jgi:membrane-bound metal-dependent hydrolase YbcI (DUF457 family)
MPLLVGHALAGATVCAAAGADPLNPADRRILLAAAFLGVLPDADLIFPWVLGLGIGWHGGFTHSILFAVVAGALVARRFRPYQVKNTVTLISAALTHPLLDAAMKRTYSGAALFWPITSKMYKLGLTEYFAFYPDSKLDPPVILILRALQISFYELIIFGSLFVLFWGGRRFVRQRREKLSST